MAEVHSDGRSHTAAVSLADTKELAKRIFESQKGTPTDFADLLQKLFSCTILQQGQSLSVYEENGHAVIGVRLRERVLRLTNGNFVKFYMTFDFGKGQPLSIRQSAFQYQLDQARMSKQFVFRYDYSAEPEPLHPAAHLQINGALATPEAAPDKLSNIRFPVNRPSVESMLRLLINDFGVVPNDAKNWSEILDFSEEAFLQYQAKKRLGS